MTQPIELTKAEAGSLLDFFESALLPTIRNDPDIDSLLWLDNLMSVWRKCGGRNTFVDGGED